MSITNGPICSTNEIYGDLTTDQSGWLLSTKGSTLRICTLSTPLNSTASGVPGEIRIDANYIYVCTADNFWKRVALLTF